MCTFAAEDKIGRPSAGPREIDARSLVGRQIDAENCHYAHSGLSVIRPFFV
jgi:hypothetical protein